MATTQVETVTTGADKAKLAAAIALVCSATSACATAALAATALVLRFAGGFALVVLPGRSACVGVPVTATFF